MFSINGLLVAIGLRTSYAERYARTLHNLDTTLIDAVHAIGVTMDDDERSPYLGWYCPVRDTVAVNIHNLVNSRTCINNVMAHELIHATGHHTRVNRGHVGMQSACGYSEIVPLLPSEQDSEEVVAQYGAKLLLKHLGIESKGIEEDTVKYLKKYGRDNGPTDSEALEAVQAVKYILKALNRTKELSHVEAS